MCAVCIKVNQKYVSINIIIFISFMITIITLTIIIIIIIIILITKYNNYFLINFQLFAEWNRCRKRKSGKNEVKK